MVSPHDYDCELTLPFVTLLTSKQGAIVMQKSFNKAVIPNLIPNEMDGDFLLPELQALDELDIFESVLLSEVISHIQETDDREEWPSNERGNWTKH
jgi:hypothetical protein